MSTILTKPAAHAHGGHAAVDADATSRLHGVLAEFTEEAQVLAAAERVRDAGYTRWDVHSPYPIHGVDRAMGTKMTGLPVLVFCCGLIGALTGLGLTWWTNATNPQGYLGVPTFLQGYNVPISGKPDWSLAANIPVIFELTILFSAFGAVFGMLGLNGLPMLYQAWFRSRNFARATSDRFFISVESLDPKFDEGETVRLLQGMGAHVERVIDSGVAKVPPILITAGVLLATLGLIPPVVIAKAWFNKSTEPRIHLIQDMDNQERFKAQQAHPLFSDGRAGRAQVADTVARGDLREDPHYYEGKIDGQWATTLPLHRKEISADGKVSQALMDRGKERFTIYCSACHGLGGYGDGPTAQRVVDRPAISGGWVQPASLHDPEPYGRPVGHIFNTITNGIRTMPPYGDQIPVSDRWAIIAYVRALQRTTHSTIDDLPAEERGRLK